MKEDILEQLVDDYLQSKDYFTKHNVKFKPSDTSDDYNANDDRVASDIDVIGFNPKLEGANRVWVVSCKSWQSGFSPNYWISKLVDKDKKVSRREAWKFFRELVSEKWGGAFKARIKELTGTEIFTYVIAVTKLTGDKSKWVEWVEHEQFRKNLDGNPIKILTVKEILDFMSENKTKTVASSDVGRLLQVIRASDWKNSKDKDVGPK
jgi:hypothetical protein